MGGQALDGLYSTGAESLMIAGTQSRMATVTSRPERTLGVFGVATRSWGGDIDSRRLRVNIVVETGRPFIEEEC